MNIKKSSFLMLCLVFGVSVILYILDVPIIPSSTQITPTVFVPIPTPLVVDPTQKISKLQSFTETIGYDPEGRSETITVSVTLSENIVTELTSIHSMNDGKSRRYQMNFEAEIQPLVVGKDIKTLQLSRVAGASVTTDAFMQAIEVIRAKI